MTFQFLSFLYCLIAALFVSLASAQTATSTEASLSSPASATPILTSPAATSPSGSGAGTGNASASGTPGVLTGPPDVLLNVPTLHVGKIELDVEDLEANINLNAQVANLVTINAGVALSVQKVNITITDIDAELELIVRLGHLVDIVNRVFQSLDLNPLLISTLNNLTSVAGGVLGEVVGEVDGLLGTVTQSGTTLSFIVDNLGNIVQQTAGTAGSAASSIVGNYLQNMTFTGVENTLSGGLTQKQYSYSPLNALVDIVFNAAGQVVQATVEKATSTSSAASAATGSARRRR